MNRCNLWITALWITDHRIIVTPLCSSQSDTHSCNTCNKRLQDAPENTQICTLSFITWIH